ncbi:MAG: hypothetical protein IKD87_09095 [Oscillospiraceae bacterium]|nr:hypothetical protein [Oscillospiraceae bacterium]
MGFSVPMALFDLVPVALYLVSAVIFQRDFYSRMNKGCYAVFCAGTVMVAVGGIFKASYKLLYAFGICDFPALSDCFMPFQAVGFTLTAIAVVGYVLGKGKEKKGGSDTLAVTAAPALVTSKMLFVLFMVLGLVTAHIGYIVISLRNRRKTSAILFLVSMILELGMGYLSTRDFTKASMNWIGEGVNFLGMLFLLVGTVDLHKNVFSD